jgi:hypothetical protein
LILLVGLDLPGLGAIYHLYSAPAIHNCNSSTHWCYVGVH